MGQKAVQWLPGDATGWSWEGAVSKRQDEIFGGEYVLFLQNILFIYLAASSLNCGMQDLHCIFEILHCGAQLLIVACSLSSCGRRAQ